MCVSVGTEQGVRRYKEGVLRHGGTGREDENWGAPRVPILRSRVSCIGETTTEESRGERWVGVGHG